MLISALLLGGCGATAATEQHTVALVAKSTQTEFWLSVFAGAEAAATEYNLKLTITGPETEEDYETQNQMVAQAVSEGAEALVFSAIDYENNADAIDRAASQGVKIVAIDSSVASKLVSTYIGTDNYAAGQMAAQAVLEGRLTVSQTEALVQELLRPREAAPAPRHRRTFVVKDVRLFLNTLDRGMALMRSAGVDARCQREDHEDAICLTIRIPRGVSH